MLTIFPLLIQLVIFTLQTELLTVVPPYMILLINVQFLPQIPPHSIFISPSLIHLVIFTFETEEFIVSIKVGTIIAHLAPQIPPAPVPSTIPLFLQLIILVVLVVFV